MRFGVFTGLTGATWEAVRDMLLAGSVAAVQDRLVRLCDAGVGMLFLPTFVLPKDPRPLLDRFMAEVVPAFR